MSLTILEVSTEEAMFMWPRLEPLFQSVLDQTDGEFNIETIKVLIAWGHLKVIVVHEGKVIEGAVAIEVIEYPMFKVLRCMLLAGQNMKNWEQYEAELERQAILHGCSYVEGLVRPGMAKRALPHGYKQRYVTIRKRIIGGLQ